MTDIWVESSRSRRVRLWAESILLVLLGFTSLVAGLTNPWPAVAAAVVMFAAVLLRHWRPKLAAGLALVAGLMQLTQWTAFNPVADLGFAPICYQLAVQRDSSARRLGLLLAGLATACVAIVMPLRAPGPRTAADLVATGAALGAMGAVVAFGGWAGGFMRFQSRRAVEEQVAGRLAEADRRRLMDAYEQAQTRNRIAADMHDVVAHSWAVVAAQADGARYSLRTSPDRAEQALEVIGETARGAITDLRRILTQLRHAESDEGTIGPEQQQVVLDRMSASGMDLRFTETGERPTSSLLTLTAHRLLAESLTNALKHGDLSRPVTAILLWDKGFTLDIRNAIGATPGSGTGHGILGMTERADLAGGQVTSRREGDQWVVRATVPQPGQQAGQQAGQQTGQQTQRPQQQEQA